MNKPKYPELRQHQELLATTGFLTRPLAISEPRTALLAQGTAEWHNVSELNRTSKHPKVIVRLFIWGEQITIAQVHQREYLNACRLADLALLRFWKYRLRGGEQPPREMFNFSLEQATADSNAEKVHCGLLDEYEAQLVACGVLPTAEALAQSKASRSKMPVGSLRDIAASTLSEQRQGFLTLRGEWLGLTTQVANLVIQFQRIADSVDTIAKSQVILHSIVSKIPKS